MMQFPPIWDNTIPIHCVFLIQKQEHNIIQGDLQACMTDIFIWDCGALWQPGITAPPLHSSKICLIGFRYKASQLNGPRRPERRANWKNKGRIREAVSFWVVWLLPQERVGWISHMAIWRISTHCIYCIQWLTLGNMGQIWEEVEQPKKAKGNHNAW